jgi:glycosyltransferase involved in cell wall biosynthesis
MRFLFIYPAPGILGGVETLIARMSRWLTSNGHEVTVLVERGDNWLQTLPKEVQYVVLGNRFRDLYYYFHAKRLWASLNIATPDVIKSFDLGSSWIACQLAQILGGRCKVLAGLYASLLFKWYYAPQSRGRWNPSSMYLQNYLHCIPGSARLVCGTDQLEELRSVHDEPCVLFPIPIDTSVFDPAARAPQWGKIVSVGRLAAMKEYNLYMPDVVKELRGRGYPVTWTVYGVGEYEAEMRQRVAKEGLGDFVTFGGTAPYHRFWQVLSDAYVFVGMGTAIVEAAWFRVPNVFANPFERAGLTYGPVYRLPAGSVGPSFMRPPTLKVADEIERLLRLDSNAYRAEEELVYQHVQPHEQERSMKHFVRLVQEAAPIKRRQSLYLVNYLRWFAQRALKQPNTEAVKIHPDASVFFTPKPVV